MMTNKEMALYMIHQLSWYGVDTDYKEIENFLEESERGTDGFWSLVKHYADKLEEATR